MSDRVVERVNDVRVPAEVLREWPRLVAAGVLLELVAMHERLGALLVELREACAERG